jgi:glycosyltransferase involved in cell wall biosynthesis
MPKGSQPFVSIVTPVYNEEAHIAECIESVLAQTYQHWDYTVVDNCSTDRTAEIVRSYAARDARIRLVQNREFLSAMANCNAAVRQISPQAKYCKVVLGDDTIYPRCLERMVAAAEKHPTVGLVGAYALEGDHVALTGLPENVTFLPGREACRRHILNRQYVFGTQNSVLYRADIVRSFDPFYNESNVQADTEVCYAILRSSDFAFVHEVLTFTRVRPGSLNMASLAIQTAWANILRILVAYGPFYLTPAELDARLRQHMKAYYRFLGRSLVTRRDRKFWDYHRTELTRAGVGYKRGRVVGGLLAELADAVRRPQHTVASLLARRS